MPDGKTPITGNDPADTSRVIDETFVLAWLNHMDQAFGKVLNYLSFSFFSFYFFSIFFFLELFMWLF